MQSLINNIKTRIVLSENEIDIIKRLFRKKAIKKGEKILTGGEVCRSLYYVSEGLLRHYIYYNDKEITIHFSEENTFACDFMSFLNQTPSEKTVEALEDTELSYITHENLKLFYRDIKYGDRFGRILLEEIFLTAIQHITSVYTDSAKKKYLNFLSSFNRLQQRIAQFYIASFIGVTPQSLSRIRKRFSKN